jgi:hypothetical protein
VVGNDLSERIREVLLGDDGKLYSNIEGIKKRRTLANAA